jgi:hypothetical protein
MEYGYLSFGLEKLPGFNHTCTGPNLCSQRNLRMFPLLNLS